MQDFERLDRLEAEAPTRESFNPSMSEPTVAEPRRDTRGRGWALERRTTICFLTGIILLVAVCVVTYRALNSFADTAARVARTHQVQAEVGHLQRALVEAVAARRTYITSLEERPLEIVRDRVARAHEHLGVLRQLTADNPKQRENIAELEKLLELPLARATELPGTSTGVPPPSGASTSAGQATANEGLLTLLGRINAAEESRLQGRQKEAKRNFDLALAVVPTGTFGSVAAAAAPWSRVRRVKLFAASWVARLLSFSKLSLIVSCSP